jgi:O-antigen/teichoic acid export membrane protein
VRERVAERGGEDHGRPRARGLHSDTARSGTLPFRLPAGSVLRDVSTAYSGYLANAVFGFVTLRLVATHLGVPNFYLANLANMFMAVIAGLSEPGIGTGFVRLTARPQMTTQTRAELAVAAIWLKLGVTLGVCGLAGVLMPWITGAFMHRPDLTPILRCCLLGAGSLSLASFGTALFQMQGAFRANAAALAGAGAVRAVVVAVLCWSGRLTLWTAVDAMILMNVVQCGLTVYALRRVLRSLPWRCWSSAQITELLSYTRHLVVWVIVGTVCPRADMLLLTHLVADNRVLGFYAAAGQVCYVLPMLTGSISLVLLPRISALQTREEMQRALSRCRLGAGVVLAFFAPVALWGGSFVLLIFGPSYAPAVPVFRLLVLAAAADLALNPLSNFWHALNRPAMLSALNVARLSLVVAVAYITIPRAGILGAALAVIVSTVIPLAVQGAVLWVKIDSRPLSHPAAADPLPTES